MVETMIPLAEPNLTGKEQEYVADALAKNYVGPGGEYVEKFEDMVRKALPPPAEKTMISGSTAAVLKSASLTIISCVRTAAE